jgi:hypothetical protein
MSTPTEKMFDEADSFYNPSFESFFHNRPPGALATGLSSLGTPLRAGGINSPNRNADTIDNGFGEHNSCEFPQAANPMPTFDGPGFGPGFGNFNHMQSMQMMQQQMARLNQGMDEMVERFLGGNEERGNQKSRENDNLGAGLGNRGEGDRGEGDRAGGGVLRDRGFPGWRTHRGLDRGFPDLAFGLRNFGFGQDFDESFARMDEEMEKRMQAFGDTMETDAVEKLDERMERINKGGMAGILRFKPGLDSKIKKKKSLNRLLIINSI